MCVCVCLADLSDEQSFRELSKPIGALTAERLERLRVWLFCLLQQLIEYLQQSVEYLWQLIEYYFIWIISDYKWF